MGIRTMLEDFTLCNAGVEPLNGREGVSRFWQINHPGNRYNDI